MVVLTFKSVNEILKCDHSNEIYWAVLSCGTICYTVQGGSNFWVCGWNPKMWPFKWKLLSSIFLSFWVFGWNPKQALSFVSFWAFLPCRTIFFSGTNEPFAWEVAKHHPLLSVLYVHEMKKAVSQPQTDRQNTKKSGTLSFAYSGHKFICVDVKRLSWRGKIVRWRVKSTMH